MALSHPFVAFVVGIAIVALLGVSTAILIGIEVRGNKINLSLADPLSSITANLFHAPPSGSTPPSSAPSTSGRFPRPSAASSSDAPLFSSATFSLVPLLLLCHPLGSWIELHLHPPATAPTSSFGRRCVLPRQAQGFLFQPTLCAVPPPRCTRLWHPCDPLPADRSSSSPVS